jgi:hypothetical protein
MYRYIYVCVFVLFEQSKRKLKPKDKIEIRVIRGIVHVWQMKNKLFFLTDFLQEFPIDFSKD